MFSYFTAERICILLETLSFFLVTTDLFGQKRLESVKEKILGSNPDLELDDDKIERIVTVIQYCCVATLLISYGIEIYTRFDEHRGMANKYLGNIINYKKDKEWIVLLLYFIIVAVVIVIGGVIASGFLVIPFLFIFFGRYALLMVVKQLLKITSMEGLLLLTGTLLFIISQAISFVSTK